MAILLNMKAPSVPRPPRRRPDDLAATQRKKILASGEKIKLKPGSLVNVIGRGARIFLLVLVVGGSIVLSAVFSAMFLLSVDSSSDVKIAIPGGPAPGELVDQSRQSVDRETAYGVLMRNLQELDVIKATPAFLAYGAALGGPYANWAGNLDAALASCNPTLEEKIAAEDLKSLFREYVSSRGAENKETVFFRQKLMEFLGS